MNRKGFTLVELLVVISIISILVGMMGVAFNTQRAAARDTKRVAEVDALRKALEFFYTDNERYPSSGGGHWICMEESASFISDMENYLSMIPSDPLYPTEYEAGKKYCFYYTTISEDQIYKIFIRLEDGDDYQVYSSGGKNIALP